MKVIYGDRALKHSDQKAFASPSSYASASRQAVFHKPTRFRTEDEYRFAAAWGTPPMASLEPIDTDKLSADIQGAFKNAIVVTGDL